MHYHISYTQPNLQYVDIEFKCKVNAESTLVNLPVWRPGRYELGNFAKNIQKFNCYNEKGETLKFEKTSKSVWQINTSGCKKLIIRYNYFAAELNAGSTFLDETQLYVNPVNCFVFIESEIDKKCTLQIDVPENYIIGGAMPPRKNFGDPIESEGILAASKLPDPKDNYYLFKDYHTLVDTPFIASPTIKRDYFILDGIEINLWFQGMEKPNWSKLVTDFFIFINEQLVAMKEFPSDEYHFLFQIVPYKHYHGVEHVNSTVIALGPDIELFEPKLYDELLGISSHEFYHAWNVKTIRPIEMMPYDYTKENYSKLGYVCEGVTTYYGDLMLYKSGVFKDTDYFKTFNEQLDKHFNNHARYNLSVADSSFDTWLDGYTPGVPGRKVSIYTEGCLCAFMLDIIILKNSGNKYSLEDVMRKLYQDFAKKNKGYSAGDYKTIAEEYAGCDLSDFFNKYINGTADYEPELINCLDYVGLIVKKEASENFAEAKLGFKYLEDNNKLRITNLYPDSMAAKSGLKIGDIITHINNEAIDKNTDDLFKKSKSAISLTIKSQGRESIIKMTPSKNNFYLNYSINKHDDVNDVQKVNYNKWCKKTYQFNRF